MGPGCLGPECNSRCPYYQPSALWLGVYRISPSGRPAEKIATGIINIASRGVAGLPHITRIEALHFASGAHLIRNLYAQHCGNFLRLVLASRASWIRGRVRRELRVLLGVRSLGPAAPVTGVDLEASFLMDSSGVPMSALQSLRWMAGYYRVVPYWGGVICPTSIFFLSAPELRRAGRARGLV